MGRHSAPEDDGDLLLEEHPEAPARPRPSHRARHAAADGGPEADVVDTDVIDPEVVERALDETPSNVVDAVVVEDEAHSIRPAPAEPAPALPAAVEAPARERPGRADLRMLRSSSSLRARCLAGVILPFILYTIALVVIDRVDLYLFWIWVPAILGGVLFGAQLDAAAKAAARADDDGRAATG